MQKIKSPILKLVLRMAETSMLLALGTVLSLFTVFQAPFGGSITPFSTLPFVIIGFRFGPKWGVPSMIAGGALQLLLGLSNYAYASSLLAVVTITLFDYLLAFSAYGLAGIFRRRSNTSDAHEQGARSTFYMNDFVAIGFGAAFASLLRFVCHFLSGITVWSGWAPEGTPVWLYSLTYNGGYMIIEMITCVVGAVLIVPTLRMIDRLYK